MEAGDITGSAAARDTSRRGIKQIEPIFCCGKISGKKL